MSKQSPSHFTQSRVSKAWLVCSRGLSLGSAWSLLLSTRLELCLIFGLMFFLFCQSIANSEHQHSYLPDYLALTISLILLPKTTMIKPLFDQIKRPLFACVLSGVMYLGFKFLLAVCIEECFGISKQTSDRLLSQGMQWFTLILSLPLLLQYTYSLTKLVSASFMVSLIELGWLKLLTMTQYKLHSIHSKKISSGQNITDWSSSTTATQYPSSSYHRPTTRSEQPPINSQH